MMFDRRGFLGLLGALVGLPAAAWSAIRRPRSVSPADIVAVMKKRSEGEFEKISSELDCGKLFPRLLRERKA